MERLGFYRVDDIKNDEATGEMCDSWTWSDLSCSTFCLRVAHSGEGVETSTKGSHLPPCTRHRALEGPSHAWSLLAPRNMRLINLSVMGGHGDSVWL